MVVHVLAEAEVRRSAVQQSEQPDRRDADLHVPRCVYSHVVVPRFHDEDVAVDGDHGDAHERHGDAREDDLSEAAAQLVGDVHRVADEGGRHGEGAEREVAGGEAAQVNVGDTLQ